jgi:thiosulfate dehydrogenase [quinone] large subunit
MVENKVFYLVLRFAVAASMLGHGLVRLPKLTAFSNWMVTQFEKSMLPGIAVRIFSYCLPFVEFCIGLLLILGLFTRIASAAGGLLMVLLLFGSAMIENWEILPSQLIHAAFFAALLYNIAYNGYALDNILN